MIKKTYKNILRITGVVFTWGMVQISTTRAVECPTAGVSREVKPAESGIWEGLQQCRVCGTCGLNDFVQLGVNLFNYVIGIVGALALLAFIYGGILFLFSGGSPEQIEKGKKALVGAVIGLIVVFASYMIVGFVAQALGIGDNINILETGWFS